MNDSGNSAAAAEIAANVASIEAVPREILPNGPAREHLMQLARSGRDVYAYTAAGPQGHWNVWVETDRYRASEYAVTYQEGKDD